MENKAFGLAFIQKKKFKLGHILSGVLDKEFS